MAFFAIQYRVLFHDTMAYGSHHFLTNFKFQCIARETLYFENVVDFSRQGKQDHDNLLLLTQQGYTRNMAPVDVGQRVAVLVSAEEMTRSTVRMCFRVIRDDGQPVCCGFQTLVCVDKATGELCAAPESITRGNTLMVESLSAPDFAERVVSGRTRSIFSPEVLELGTRLANSDSADWNSGFVDIEGLASPASHPQISGPAFVFAGQGSFEPALLLALAARNPRISALLAEADRQCSRLLGSSLLQAMRGPEPMKALTLNPDLVQVGMYVTAVSCAEVLRADGVEPGVLAGHSAGELAALAVGGAYSLEKGIEIVCHRALALRHCRAEPGVMAILSGPEPRTTALIKAIGHPELVVGVRNHAKQIVASGPSVAVAELLEIAPKLGLGARLLQSPYAFHSAVLKAAQAPFKQALNGLVAGDLKTPIYSPMEKRFFQSGEALDSLLSSHFVRALDFPSAVSELLSMGLSGLVECGPPVVSKLVSKSSHLPGDFTIETPFDGNASWLLNAASAMAPAGVPDSEGEVSTGALKTDVSPQERLLQGVADEELAISQPSSVPIAVVAMGCHVPAGPDVESFWDSILNKHKGLHRADKWDPTLKEDFLEPLSPAGKPVSDKTYTLLGGFIADGDGARPVVPPGRSSAQVFLDRALSECSGSIKRRPANGQGVMTFLGATADGIAEYDEALLANDLLGATQSTEERALMAKAIQEDFALDALSLGQSKPFDQYKTVIQELLGPEALLETLDAACASSLYAVVLGALALKQGRCDVAMCGGVFAPGPANSCLFSQFRGLSDSGSRPLDKGADGVVFGEGASFVALKRLDDALRDGEEVLAIVAGYGLGSDGKSPSVAVPKRKGQAKTMERAYVGAGLSPQNVQVVEAHATSTPVGDSVEFSALADVFGEARLASVSLGSVKATTGHTGWAAGTTSVVKMVSALKHRIMPAQSSFSQANGKIDLESSAFEVKQEASHWPENTDGLPRTCAINSFGFGGANAHILLQDYSGQGSVGSPVKVPQEDMVLVAFDALLPGVSGAFARPASELTLPKGVLMLPDVVDDMDDAQKLAVSAAHGVLQQLGEVSKSLKGEIGVVLGMAGKTLRGREVNQRLYGDRLLRQLSESKSFSRPQKQRLQGVVQAHCAAIPASGPYTLPGIMPNVIAGRVANAFSLQGPNLVVGAGDDSLWQALSTSESLLQGGCAKLVIAGALVGGASGASYERGGEGIALVAMCSPAVASEFGLETLGTLKLSGPGELSGPTQYRSVKTDKHGAASGALEVLNTLKAGPASTSSTALKWPSGALAQIQMPGRSAAKPVPGAMASSLTQAEQLLASNILGPEEPVERLGTQLQCVQAGEVLKTPLKVGSLLLLCDDSMSQQSAEILQIAQEQGHQILTPKKSRFLGGLAVDLKDDESSALTLDNIDFARFTGLLCLTSCRGMPGQERLLTVSQEGLLELLFAVSKRLYPSIQQGQVALASVCLTEAGQEEMHPVTGLFGGYLKALHRELDQGVIRAVQHDGATLAEVMPSVLSEWSRRVVPGSVEVVFRGGERFEERLIDLGSFHQCNSHSNLNSGSVIVATGGGRGVTAELMVAVLERFKCKVVLLGRSDPASVPLQFAQMSLDEMEGARTDFYRQGLANKQGSIRDLKSKFDRYLSAREVAINVARLAAIGGTTKYVPCDVSDAPGLERIFAQINNTLGPVDLLIHGAGLQKSGQLAKKPIAVFRRIVGVKVSGFYNLRRALAVVQPKHPVHFHTLGSAFSHLGNDGQPDYGAANEGMARLAAWEDVSGNFTSMAWLGWAGIGMTRGSEYAALASNRGLKALTAPEGQSLFLELLDGRSASPNNIQMTAGERRFYKVPRGEAQPACEAFAVQLDSTKLAYLRHHLVAGRPTLPGTFEADIAARAARALFPQMNVVEMRGIKLSRFVKVFPNSPIQLQGRTRILRRGKAGAWVKVQLLSNQVHRTGRLLQANRLHFESVVHLVEGEGPLHNRRENYGPRPMGNVGDPYTLKNGSVELSGIFDVIRNVHIGSSGLRGEFVPPEQQGGLTELKAFITPAVLLDSLFRFSMLQLPDNGKAEIFVPLGCESTLLKAGLVDSMLFNAGGVVSLSASAPVLANGRCYNQWARAVAEDGTVLLEVRGLEGMPFATVTMPSEMSLTQNGVVSPVTISQSLLPG